MRGSPNHVLSTQVDQTSYHDIAESLSQLVDPDLAYEAVYDPVLYSGVQELEFVQWWIPTSVESDLYMLPYFLVHAYIRESVRG
jgi:hypothetical protein